MTWPEEYVPPADADCGRPNCSKCRSEPTREQLLAEHKRRLKAGEVADLHEYTPEEQLVNSRVEAARRRGDYR